MLKSRIESWGLEQRESKECAPYWLPSIAIK